MEMCSYVQTLAVVPSKEHPHVVRGGMEAGSGFGTVGKPVMVLVRGGSRRDFGVLRNSERDYKILILTAVACGIWSEVGRAGDHSKQDA
jgi:hypothetical protein